MRVGIFGSKYQVEKQSQIKRLFEKLISQEAEIYVDVRFYNFLTDILNYEPPVAGLLTDDNFDLDVALSVGGDERPAYGCPCEPAGYSYSRN